MISESLGEVDYHDAQEDELFLSVQAYSVYNIAFRWTMELLERTHPRLPATLYGLIDRGPGRFLRIWDFADAAEMLEWKWDLAADDPEWAAEHEAYYSELPRPGDAVPPALRRAELSRDELTQLLGRLSPGDRAGAILSAALEAVEHAGDWETHELGELVADAISEADYTLPHPGISFALEWDDVYDGLLEEYGQEQFNAGVPFAPSSALRIRLADAESVRRAHELVVALTKTLHATARMLELLPRRDPSALSEVLVEVHA